MAAGKIVWDALGEHLFETGVDHGVLYPQADNGSYGDGVAWNGLTGVTENPSGAEATPLYADNIKYLNLISAEDYGITIEAYTYPEEFEDCDGSREPVAGVKLAQQVRKGFGFCYRTLVGNDVKGNDYGYKIHLVYGCKAAPSERAYETVNDSPDAITFSWEINTTPVAVADVNNVSYKPTAHIEIDSTAFTTTAQKDALTAFEDILYGKNATTTPSASAVAPRLPLPDEVISLLTVS